MTTGFVKEQNLDIQIQRQMGCMAGFLQIFDRHHILTGKRFYSTKRLPPPPLVDTTTSESEKSAPQSPPNPTDSLKPLQKSKQTPAAATAAELPPPKPPLPLPIFELKSGTKSSSWKFSKEAPRLSLDSRATTDAKGGLHPKQIRTTTSAAAVASNGGNSIASGAADVDQQQHRSTSVIARLMGLDPYPNSSDSEPEKKPELRRSASESRVSKDLFQSRFITDGGNFYSKQQTQSHSSHTPPTTDAHFADPNKHSIKKAPEGLNRGRLNSTPPPWKAPPQQRKNFFDSGDVFPEPKQTVSTISIYGEIEKRIKVRGIDETSKDLETLKQLLEALQLKGLLHPKQPPPQQNEAVRRHRNFVYDESPIVLMKPIRSSDPNGRNQVRRNYSLAGETSPSVSPMRERNVRSPTRGTRGPGTGPSPITRSNSPVKPRQLSVETQRKASPVHSPKRRAGPDPTATNQSQRRKKRTAQIRHKDDESSSISGSSVTTVSTDTERWRGDEQKEGRNILERCDKLLHSIAEMSAAADMQPSPVSVLDSSFYKDDSLTPSPVTTKRNLDFKDQPGELEEETWSPVISPIRTKWVETSDDREFAYISDILRASHHHHHHHLQDESDVFLLLEKQQFLKGNHDTCKASTLQRKLIFDAISEITDRDKQLPPWNKCATAPSLDKVWSEFQTIRERPEKTGEDLFETVCGVLKRDLAITAWGDFPIEMSEGVLDIERLIFKDLIGEIIGDLAVLAAASGMLSSAMPMRRKLVF